MAANSAGRILVDRNCPQCGNTFQCPRTSPPSRCCSYSCGYAARSARQAGEQQQAPSDAPSSTPVETDEVTGDRRVLTKVVHERIKTLADLVRVCNIDTSEWKIERHTINKWEGFNVPRATRPDGATDWVRPDSTPVITELWQVKAWMVLRVGLIAVTNEIEALKTEAKKHAPRYAPVKLTGAPSGNMLEINIPDLHLAKLAWGKETGWENYDLKIGELTHDRALEGLLARTSAYKFDEVLFVLGNDHLNADNQENTTTRGTVVSSDGRQQKTFIVARKMAIRAIERLRLVSRRVVVKLVPGNHDANTNFYLGDSLECWFHNCPGVIVDNAPTKRKYHEFGSCMLLFTHGNTGKRADYPLLMATEQPEMFGRTKYREAHTGHLHKTQVDEHHGVRVRILPALCPPDAWHAENAFVGNVRAAEAYVWNKDEGLMSIAVYADRSERSA